VGGDFGEQGALGVEADANAAIIIADYLGVEVDVVQLDTIGVGCY
jgi:hypothetical protein